MCGYLPISGVPLILVTYGGNSVITTMVALGILQSILYKKVYVLMFKHKFIFEPFSWIGEGHITLNMVDEELVFYTKWNVLKSDVTEKIQSIPGNPKYPEFRKNMRNELTFFDFAKNSFSVEMENLNIGKVIGSGIVDDKVIAWEFRNNEVNFEGFENICTAR